MDALLNYFSQSNLFTDRNLMMFWGGLTETVQLVSISLVIGLILAVPVAVTLVRSKGIFSKFLAAYVYVFRGTPLLIQLYIIYYGVAYIEGIQESVFWLIFKEAFFPCLIAFVLNTTAYTAEIFRGAILTTPKGEVEAARAYGMSEWQAYKRIILPNAFRRALPAYSNEVIFMLHASSIASTVTILDLTGVARYMYARYYTPFEPFIFVALIYLVMTFSLVLVFRYLEKRLSSHLQPLAHN